jgi:hypothetical protein
MKLPIKPFILVLVILCQATLSRGDQEAANQTYVTASKYGQFYAKSIPHERYGLKGITRIYQVTKAEDILIQTYDWYSPQIFLEGFTGSHEVYVVQMGPWHRGHEALAEHHAIALYKNDQLLRTYSTLDLVGVENKVSRSVSHYTIFSNIHGFRRPFGNQLVFDVENHEGAIVSFDAETGGLLTREEETLKKNLYEAGVKIAQLKWRWYEGNKEKIPAINDVVITEDVLRRFAQEDFPNLPEGYRYIPDTMWKPARFETHARGVEKEDP